MLLVASSGHIVEKDELINRVWADSFVEEGNLKVTVSMLRKVLEEGETGEQQFIQTVPRRGYRFVAEVRELSDPRQDVILLERTQAEVLIEGEESTGQEQDQISRSARDATKPSSALCIPSVRWLDSGAAGRRHRLLLPARASCATSARRGAFGERPTTRTGGCESQKLASKDSTT